MSESRQNLLIQAGVIKNETRIAKNTAKRIGGMLEQIVSGSWLEDVGLPVNITGTVSGSASLFFQETGSFYATTNNLQVTGSLLQEGIFKTDNLTVEGSSTLNGPVTVDGDLLPAQNLTYDLGSSTQRWNELYLSGSTIYLGDRTISVEPDGQIVSRKLDGSDRFDLIGEVGPVGPPGPAGAGLNVKGTFDAVTDLNGVVNPDIGDGYVAADDFYIWDGQKFEIVNFVTGPSGSRGPAGPPGVSGSQGKDGQGIRIIGGLEEAPPPVTSELESGDAYNISGTLWVWNGSAWENTGPIGPQGPRGSRGDPFQVDAEGLLTDRDLYDDRFTGYTYYATDVGRVYIKLEGGLDPSGSNPGDRLPGPWSQGIQFRGPEGERGQRGRPGFGLEINAIDVTVEPYVSQSLGFTVWNPSSQEVFIRNDIQTTTGSIETDLFEKTTLSAGPQGPQGEKGDQGIQGENPSLRLNPFPQTGQRYLQWYDHNTEDWVTLNLNLVTTNNFYTESYTLGGGDPRLRLWQQDNRTGQNRIVADNIIGPRGPQGEKGERGYKGSGFDILDSGSAVNRPANPPVEFTYYATDTGDLYYYTNSSGSYVTLDYKGISGEDGTDGIDGSQGVSIQYNWDGTQLGVKQDTEQSYTYVDLKGDNLGINAVANSDQTGSYQGERAGFTLYAPDDKLLYIKSAPSGSDGWETTAFTEGPRGIQGLTGPKGPTGPGVTLRGRLDNYTNNYTAPLHYRAADAAPNDPYTQLYDNLATWPNFRIQSPEPGEEDLRILEWRREGFSSTISWSELGNIRGEQGLVGPRGVKGSGFDILDSGSAANKPATPPAEFTYYATDTGQLFYYTDSSGSFVELEYRGPIGPSGSRGPSGADGIDGTDGTDGADGTDFQISATGTDRTAYDSASVGFTFFNEVENKAYIRTTGGGWDDLGEFRGPSGSSGPRGFTGDDGIGLEYDVTSIEGRVGIKREDETSFNYVNVRGEAVNFVFRGQWSAAGTYVRGDYVIAPSTFDPSYDSLWFLNLPTFIANHQSNLEPRNDTTWLEFRAERGPQGIAGDTGPQGRITFRQTWQAGTTYNNGDVVIAPATFNPLNANSFWLALETINTAVEPWQLQGADREKWEEIILSAGQGSLPEGGTEGQALLKSSDNSYQVGWYTIPTFADLNGKVDKAVGKTLTDENFTTDFKTKLESVQPPLFKGSYTNTGSLETAVPNPEDGSYAFVDLGVGNDVVKFIWDITDSKWVEQAGATTQLTSAQIKEEYESNADTNPFTNAASASVGNLPADTQQEITDINTTLVDKQDIAATTASTIPVRFEKETVYGTELSPIATDISTNLDNAKLGVTVILIHQSNNVPVLPSTFKKMVDTPDYITGTLNFFYIQYISPSTQIYSITQVESQV